MNQLCCLLNEINTCWKCSAKLCVAHSGREAAELFWCEECYDLDSDNFALIQNLHEKLGDASAAYEEVVIDLDTIAEHPSMCKTCKADEYCDSLISLAADFAKEVSRRYSRRTF